MRGYLGGELVFDTTRPMLVWEVPYHPAYYIPERDVVATLDPNGDSQRSPSRGDGECLDVRTGAVEASGIAWRYPDSPIEPLRGSIRFEWDAIDEWLTEDEPVYTHPRDPYTRVDVLRSSRHVQVVVDGVKVAETTHPTMLFETGLPPRFYLPLADVRMDLLRPSETKTYCPYKGEATYWSLEIDGHRARGSGVDLSFAARREPEDRRAGQVLQREGGPVRRRGTPGTTGTKFS